MTKMPRTNFGAAMERARAREAALAALPREVREGVLTLPEAQQEAYLASLGKVDAMIAAGEEFTPDLSKAKANAKSKAKGKGGRPAAANAGQRTQEKMEPSLHRPVDLERLEAILDYPEDDPEVSVIFGTRDGTTPAQPGPTASQLQAQRDAALEAQRRAELEAALAKVQDTSHGREIVSPVFTGKKRIEPDPADPLSLATITEFEFRITADQRDYVLERREANGSWQEVSRSYEVSGLAVGLAVARVVPSSEFHEAVRQLPQIRPAREAYLAQFKTKGARTTPFTAEEKAEREKELKASLDQQRAANRVRSGSRPPTDYRWF